MSLITDADGTPFGELCEYDSVVGMLMYLSSNSRSDIHFVVHQCASFTHNPRKIHAGELKRIFRYLVVTQWHVLTFDHNSDMNLDCYVGLKASDRYLPVNLGG